MPKFIPRILLGCLIGVGLCSCASEKAKTESKKAKEDKDEYVWVTPTGSHVPVRVKKNDAKTSDEVTRESKEALRQYDQVRNSTATETMVSGSGGPK